MNVHMWAKALQVIPRISKEEWGKLDVISKWLIATRAAVLIITFISAAIAGILAFRVQKFDLGLWLVLTIGLIFAHATNNLINDITDYRRGVDKDNYFRAQYGPQPLEHGLMTIRQVLAYVAVTGLIALLCGVYLVHVARIVGAGAAGGGRLLRALLYLAAQVHRPGRAGGHHRVGQRSAGR